MPDVYLTDLSTCQPSDALSPEWRDGRWMLLPYETADGLSGTMVYYTYYPLFHAAMRRPAGGSFLNPPEISLPLPVGRFAIHLAMQYATNSRLEGPQIRVRLSTEDTVFTVGREQCQPKDGDFPEKTGFGHFELAEVYWRTTDVAAGARLVIAPPEAYYGTEHFFANLAYVRLVPVTDDTVRYASNNTGNCRRLVAYYGGPPRTPEAARDWIDCFEGSDFSLVLWGASGDTDPQVCRAALDRAHELGLRVHASLRFSGWKMDNYLPIHEIYAEHSLGSAIVSEHPEWRKRAPDGLPTNSLSLAFEEVCRFWLAEIERLLDLGFDGLNLVMARCFPFVLYEDPVVDEFRARHGDDPRQLPPDDERWLAHRADIVTGFVRRVRGLADDVGARSGRRLETSYHVMNSLANSRFFTMDAARWIREGLVDHCIVHPSHSRAPGMPDEGAVTPASLAGFIDAARDTGCRIYADVYPRRMPAEAYRRAAMSLYEAGVDGLAFWDTHVRRTRLSEWSLIRRLGHRDDLAGWERDTDGLFRRTPLRSLQGVTTDRAYSFTDG